MVNLKILKSTQIYFVFLILHDKRAILANKVYVI